MTWTSISALSQIDPAHIAQLVDHVEDERFDEVLLGILQEKGPAAEVNGFIYAARDRDPRPVSWCGRPDGTAQRVDRYARAYHRYDPTLHSLPSANRNDSTFVEMLTADRIGDAAYRETCFESPAFSQKISIAQAGAGGEWTILNMYLGEPGVAQETVQRLAAFGSLIVPFLRRRANGVVAQPRHAADRLSRKLQRRFPTLTGRERSVCALTMIGKSSGEIATALGIRPGTVITYRRRAYERLGISSAAVLVAEIL